MLDSTQTRCFRVLCAILGVVAVLCVAQGCAASKDEEPPAVTESEGVEEAPPAATEAEVVKEMPPAAAESEDTEETPPAETEEIAADWQGHEVPDGQLHVLLVTDQGRIFLELFPEIAPVTVASFVNLAQRGFYDGLTFHRVMPGFMAQGGDPTGTGEGGPGYLFENECVPEVRFNKAGVLGMAKTPQPRTNGSQFFITYGPQPYLNGLHTIFGQVLEGQDVVGRLKNGSVIQKIVTEGDCDALLKQQAARIAEWNAALEKKGF